MVNFCDPIPNLRGWDLYQSKAHPRHPNTAQYKGLAAIPMSINVAFQLQTVFRSISYPFRDIPPNLFFTHKMKIGPLCVQLSAGASIIEVDAFCRWTGTGSDHWAVSCNFSRWRSFVTKYHKRNKGHLTSNSNFIPINSRNLRKHYMCTNFRTEMFSLLKKVRGKINTGRRREN